MRGDDHALTAEVADCAASTDRLTITLDVGLRGDALDALLDADYLEMRWPEGAE